MVEEQQVRMLTPEEAIEEIKRQTNPQFVQTVEQLPEHYVHLSMGIGHEIMLTVRFHEGKLDDVFAWGSRIFEKWLEAHTDGDEGNGSGPTPPTAGVPYHA